MKVWITNCDGLNSLGGCHRQVTEQVTMTIEQAKTMGVTIDNGIAELLPRPDCNLWAGCKGGCNDPLRK